MSSPTLSVVGLTRNSAARLPWWIGRVREYADEVALLVDESSDDGTFEVARQLADSALLVEHPPFTASLYQDLSLRRARCDWILMLDDDELMSDAFASAKAELLAEQYLAHYWIPYRWLLPVSGGGYAWLASFPWHPNPRLRLVRNVGSTFQHRGRLHSPWDVAGDGRILESDEGAMYHFDLLWHDRAQREEKVRRYRGHDSPSCEEYYLYEEYLGTAATVPLGGEDPLRPGRGPGRAPAPVGTRPDLPGPQRVTIAAEQARLAAFWDDAGVYGADYGWHGTPGRMLTNRGYAVELEVRNTSGIPWRAGGPERGRVQLSYHWVQAETGVVLLREGDRSLLPRTLAPGEKTTITAGVWAPYEPGRYRLDWDLIAEGISWFSERGVPALSVAVEVGPEDRLLERRRLAAELPVPPPLTTRRGLTRLLAAAFARRRRPFGAVGGRPPGT